MLVWRGVPCRGWEACDAAVPVCKGGEGGGRKGELKRGEGAVHPEKRKGKVARTSTCTPRPPPSASNFFFLYSW